jgi:peptidoglycan hydrolase CwlO-like protein
VGGLVLGAAGAAWVQQYRVDGLQTALDAKTTLIEGEGGLNAQISGLKTSVEDRDGKIKQLSADIDKLTADFQDTQQATLDLLDAAEARADATEKKMAKERRKADAAAPQDKPRLVSEPARSAATWGLCRADAIAAGSDPRACGD